MIWGEPSFPKIWKSQKSQPPVPVETESLQMIERGSHCGGALIQREGSPCKRGCADTDTRREEARDEAERGRRAPDPEPWPFLVLTLPVLPAWGSTTVPWSIQVTVAIGLALARARWAKKPA